MNKLNLLMILTLTSCGNMSGGSTPTNNRNGDTTPTEDRADRDRDSKDNVTDTKPATSVNNEDVPTPPPAPPLPGDNTKKKRVFFPKLFGGKKKKTPITEDALTNPVDELKDALSRKARPGSAIFKAKQLSEEQKQILEKEKEALKAQLENEQANGIGLLKKAKRTVFGHSIIKKLEKTEDQLQNDAAITIQSAWKGYSLKKNKEGIKVNLDKAKQSLLASQKRRAKEAKYKSLKEMLVFKNILGPIEPISYDNTNENGEQQQEPVYALATNGNTKPEGPYAVAEGYEVPTQTNNEAEYF